MINRSQILSEYKVLNRIAKGNGVVLFGSTTAVNFHLNELMQDYGFTRNVYNRSIAELTIEDSESYIKSCINELSPEVILLNLGETELVNDKYTVEEIIEQYRWLLYQIHISSPKTRIALISVNAQTAKTSEFNKQLRLLAKEYGCQYADAPSNMYDSDFDICFFHAIKSFLYDRSMTLADALHYCAI
ncbi:MAG: hypothetical protein IJZ64_03865 [Ruminococcus sp.]|nr:hypothetical protein [Ruminococcus sp.]